MINEEEHRQLCEKTNKEFDEKVTELFRPTMEEIASHLKKGLSDLQKSDINKFHRSFSKKHNGERWNR